MEGLELMLAIVQDRNWCLCVLLIDERVKVVVRRSRLPLRANCSSLLGLYILRIDSLAAFRYDVCQMGQPNLGQAHDRVPSMVPLSVSGKRTDLRSQIASPWIAYLARRN